jgi:hypothetical protein
MFASALQRGGRADPAARPDCAAVEVVAELLEMCLAGLDRLAPEQLH